LTRPSTVVGAGPGSRAAAAAAAAARKKGPGLAVLSDVDAKAMRRRKAAAERECDRLREATLCSICLDAPRCLALLPCAHCALAHRETRLRKLTPLCAPSHALRCVSLPQDNRRDMSDLSQDGAAHAKSFPALTVRRCHSATME